MRGCGAVQCLLPFLLQGWDGGSLQAALGGFGRAFCFCRRCKTVVRAVGVGRLGRWQRVCAGRSPAGRSPARGACSPAAFCPCVLSAHLLLQ